MGTLAAAISACLLSACQSSQKAEPTEVAPELKLEGVRFRVWRGEIPRAWGEASEVTIRRDTNEAKAALLRADLPSQDGPVVITAPRAQGVLSTQVFSGEGGVLVTHADERATSQRARYEPGPAGTGLVSGTDPVTVERRGMRLSGVGFTFDPRTGDLRVGGPVETRAAGAGR